MSRIANPNNLTKAELARRWGAAGVPLTIRQVERRIKKYGLLPVDWHGRQPEFNPADVAGMEERRRAHLINLRQPVNVITVAQAKKIAKKGGAK